MDLAHDHCWPTQLVIVAVALNATIQPTVDTLPSMDSLHHSLPQRLDDGVPCRLDAVEIPVVVLAVALVIYAIAQGNVVVELDQPMDFLSSPLNPHQLPYSEIAFVTSRELAAVPPNLVIDWFLLVALPKSKDHNYEFSVISMQLPTFCC